MRPGQAGFDLAVMVAFDTIGFDPLKRSGRRSYKPKITMQQTHFTSSDTTHRGLMIEIDLVARLCNTSSPSSYISDIVDLVFVVL